MSSKNASDSKGVARAGVKKVHQLARANTIAKSLREVCGTASRAEGALQHQLTQLCSAVKSDQLKDDLQGLIEKNRLPAERFRPAFNAPALLPNIRLDFDCKDGKGQVSTPEGKLRQSVYVSTNTKNVTVARGAMSPVHGVSGMAGVGKTTALIGLGHDTEFRKHFTDGVLYMSLGAAATVEHVACELSK